MTSIPHRAPPLGRAEAPAKSGLTPTDLMLLGMSVIWGVNVTVVKYGTMLIPAVPFNAVRVSLAAVALCGIAWAGARGGSMSRRDFWALLGLGVLGNGVYQLCFIEGVARTRAGTVALVLAASPAFVALFGRLLGVERVSRRGMAGIALSFVGIALVIFGTPAGADADSAAAASTRTGDALILAGTLCWAFFSVMLKPYTERVDTVTVSALTMLGGAVALVAIGAPAVARISWLHIGMPMVGVLLFSGIGSLVIAYIFWSRGVQVLGPTRTAVYGNLQPIFTLLAAWVWPALREVPTVWQGLGTVAIIGGVLLTRP